MGKSADAKGPLSFAAAAGPRERGTALPFGDARRPDSEWSRPGRALPGCTGSGRDGMQSASRPHPGQGARGEAPRGAAASAAPVAAGAAAPDGGDGASRPGGGSAVPRGPKPESRCPSHAAAPMQSAARQADRARTRGAQDGIGKPTPSWGKDRDGQRQCSTQGRPAHGRNPTAPAPRYCGPFCFSLPTT